MRSLNRHKHAGFTLIELLVVIAIIGLLASIVLVATSTSRTQAKNAAVMAQIRQAPAQASVYYSNNSNFGANVGSCAQNPTDSSQYPWVNQAQPNIFTLPVSQGGLKELVDRLTQNSQTGTSASLWCATGPYAVAYYGLPTTNWAIYVVMLNGNRICIDNSDTIRTYSNNPWVWPYLWDGTCN